MLLRVIARNSKPKETPIFTRKLTARLLIVATFSLSLIAAAEVYKLPGVKRVDSDLYRSGNLYIQTSYCYHYTYGEDAILKWDGYGGTIIWDDNSTCDVKRIFRK